MIFDSVQISFDLFDEQAVWIHDGVKQAEVRVKKGDESDLKHFDQ